MADVEKARFTCDGYPANLPAAALDALHWLQTFRQSDALGKFQGADETRPILARCIAALGEHLRPHLPHEIERAYPGVVAEVVCSSPERVSVAPARGAGEWRGDENE